MLIVYIKYAVALKNMKTSKEIRDEFDRTGESISQWAIDNGYVPSLVYRVLSSETLPKRGKSHDIAVKLGLKEGIASVKRASATYRATVTASTREE